MTSAKGSATIEEETDKVPDIVIGMIYNHMQSTITCVSYRLMLEKR